MDIEKIIISGPCTIVFWDDKTKTVVRRSSGDKDDFEAAVNAAIVKKIMGNSRNRVKEYIERLKEITVHKGKLPDAEPEGEEHAGTIVGVISDVINESAKIVIKAADAITGEPLEFTGTPPEPPEAETPLPKPARQMTMQEKTDLIKRLSVSGKTDEEIAEIMHITKSTVRHYRGG